MFSLKLCHSLKIKLNQCQKKCPFVYHSWRTVLEALIGQLTTSSCNSRWNSWRRSWRFLCCDTVTHWIKVIIGLMFIFAENIYMDMKDCRIPIDLDQIDGLQRLSIINMQNHCIQNHFNFIRNNIQGWFDSWNRSPLLNTTVQCLWLCQKHNHCSSLRQNSIKREKHKVYPILAHLPQHKVQGLSPEEVS